MKKPKKNALFWWAAMDAFSGKTVVRYRGPKFKHAGLKPNIPKAPPDSGDKSQKIGIVKGVSVANKNVSARRPAAPTSRTSDADLLIWIVALFVFAGPALEIATYVFDLADKNRGWAALIISSVCVRVMRQRWAKPFDGPGRLRRDKLAITVAGLVLIAALCWYAASFW